MVVSFHKDGDGGDGGEDDVALMKTLCGDEWQPARAALRDVLPSQVTAVLMRTWGRALYLIPLGSLLAPSCAEPCNQHTVGTQSMFAGWMADLILDSSLSKPHQHKKKNATFSSSSCFYISRDSGKRSWFL